jgi:hypothetical protein
VRGNSHGFLGDQTGFCDSFFGVTGKDKQQNSRQAKYWYENFVFHFLDNSYKVSQLNEHGKFPVIQGALERIIMYQVFWRMSNKTVD